jgi:peptidyl-tRNA hydrolase, PTH1 family
VKLVVGLGNPGRKYQNSRHNLGFWTIDDIARENRISVKKKLCDALVGEWPSGGETTVMAKPQTYMNRSGESVSDLLRHFRADPGDLIVIHDDLDLPFGRMRIRPGGGAAGHRGVLSIIQSLGTEEFYRVRLGIGRPPDGVDPTDFVLESFTSEELDQLAGMVSRAAQAVVFLLREGGTRAMEQFNRPQ